MNILSPLLGINVDHVATLRQARGTRFPDPVQAALVAEAAGADGITVHLREDRRHIQERDIELLQQVINTRLNLEMAATDEMVDYACRIKPVYVCLVPEKREELTTEGGLDVMKSQARITDIVAKLTAHNIKVSLFIDADLRQIDAAVASKAPYIEIHTGHYADTQEDEQQQAYEKIVEAARYAHSAGLTVNAGHGLNYHNVTAIAAIPEIYELNIGHSIVARAVLDGMANAVQTMKQLMILARTRTL